MELVEANTHSQALTRQQRQQPVSTSLISAEKLEELRKDRETHKYKTIWTKDAHGGPYKKANAKKGIDPFKEHLDGSKKVVELGYEEAECGPTSNFVGNHMTQGAIDLVQAELKRKPNSYPHISFAPERISNPDEVLPARLPAPETKSTGKPLCTAETQGGCAKPLRQVDWCEDENYLILLLQRPFTEDLSTVTSLRADLSESSIEVQYHIKKKKHESKDLEYRFHVPKLHANINTEECGLYLGSGSLEEIQSSTNILKLGPTCTVSHSDPSTLICLVLAKISPGKLWKQVKPVENANQNIVERIEHQYPDLDGLKSFVRHQLRS